MWWCDFSFLNGRIVVRRFLYLIFLLPIGLKSQTSPGNSMECTKDRTFSVNGQLLYLAKGEILETLTFLNWEPGLMTGLMYFTNTRGDTLEFWANEDFLKDTITGICYAMRTDIPYNDKRPVFYCRKKDFPDSLVKYALAPDSRWHIIYRYFLDYDSVVLGGRCNGTGRNIHELWPLGKPLKSALRLHPDSFYAYLKSENYPNKRYCPCPADPAMEGIFKDKITGEELQIQLNPLQVKYRSKSKPQWKILYVQQHFPGWLTVSFSADFKKEVYPLFFTGDTWMIPGDKWSKTELQFFQRP